LAQRRERSAGPASPSDLLVIGRNSVAELLENNPGNVETLLLQDGVNPARLPGRLAELVGKTKSESCSPRELDSLAGTDSHQGVVARLKHRQYHQLEQFLESDQSTGPGVILALDSISDPHNFGAILRAAECFGVKAVVWSRNRGSGITPVVTKVSSGASELVPLMPVSNLANALETLKAAGFWVVCSDSGDDSVELGQSDLPERLVLVLGSEGDGVQPLIRKRADFVVRIPMRGKIDSLNVAQAAAVMLAALSGERP